MEEKYTSLVFEGGGVKGFAYIGSILALEKKIDFKKLDKFAGSSVGSLFAVLLSIGFTGEEILKLKTLDFSMETNYWCTTFYNLLKKRGIYSLKKFEKLFRGIIKTKVDPDITLGDLYKKTKKDLVIVTTNLNTRRAIYLHHAKYPNVKLIDSLLCSICVPGIFQPRKMNITGTEDYYIDGGVAENYPIWVFNDLEKLSKGEIDFIRKESEIPSTTLGLKLLGYDEDNDMRVFNGRTDILNLRTYIIEIINTLILQIEISDITPSYIKQTIPIKVSNISFIDFELSDKEINELIENGKKYVDMYFK